MPVYLSRPDSLLDEHHLVVLQQSEERWHKSLLASSTIWIRQKDGVKACWFFNNQWKMSSGPSPKKIDWTVPTWNLNSSSKNICIQSNESINKIEVSKKTFILKKATWEEKDQHWALCIVTYCVLRTLRHRSLSYYPVFYLWSVQEPYHFL